jgi:hypothetical protein
MDAAAITSVAPAVHRELARAVTVQARTYRLGTRCGGPGPARDPLRRRWPGSATTRLAAR